MTGAGVARLRERGNVKDLIEQALARGDTLDQICASVGVTPRTVDDVMRAMDKAAAMPDVFWMQSRNQRADQCRNGHPRTPENTYIKPRDGKRECRICKAPRDKRPRTGAA